MTKRKMPGLGCEAYEVWAIVNPDNECDEAEAVFPFDRKPIAERCLELLNSLRTHYAHDTLAPATL